MKRVRQLTDNARCQVSDGGADQSPPPVDEVGLFRYTRWSLKDHTYV